MTTQMPDATSPFTLSAWQPEPRAGDETDIDRSSDDHGTRRPWDATTMGRADTRRVPTWIAQAQIAMIDIAVKRATAVSALAGVV